MSDEDDLQPVRAAKNESIFREVNERIRELNEAWVPSTPLGDWVCECADPTCAEQVSMTLPAYEALRRKSDHFVVVRGHERAGVEVVVEEADEYRIVAKTGIAGAVAAAEDPRG